MPHIKTVKEHTVLLDTHIFLWYMEGNTILSSHFRKALETHSHSRKALISAISIWEIGMLAERGRIQLDMDVLEWTQRALKCPLIELVELSPEIAIQSCRLPGTVHGDPADRILIATAHTHNAVLATCDMKILEYGQDRFVSVHNPCNK
jgi:PIN domain nuclease of toxin-antitoxin system